jgi:Rrf2 family protein
VKYLEQILTVLRQAHLIRSIKGFKGGYVVARPAEQITFREIIDALDVTILEHTGPQGTDSGSVLKTLVHSCLWEKMTVYLQEFAGSITLADLTEKYRASIADAEALMYYI